MPWLKEGDENTSYFHPIANGRKNKNFIPWILQDNNRVDDTKKIGDAFKSFYQNLCGTTQDFRIKINWLTLLGSKAHHDLSSLNNPFTHEEIRRAAFDMKADKAPGPNGILIFFFQKYWDIVKLDIF